MPGADECISRVEISLEAQGLADKDVLSKSDPFAILYTRFPDSVSPSVLGVQNNHAPAGKIIGGRTHADAFNKNTLDNGWLESGRTETVTNCLNPRFAESFEIAFFFEKQQEIRVELFDRDSKSDARLARHDFLGSAELTMAELVSAPSQRRTLPLHIKSRTKGTVTVYVEEVAKLKRAIQLDLLVPKLKTGIIPKQGPIFLRILRSREGGQWVVVYSSKKTTYNKKKGYDLRTINISSQKFNNGDVGRPLRFEVLSYSARGAHVLRGRLETTETQLLSLVSEETSERLPDAPSLTFWLNNRVTGEMEVQMAISQQVPTFLDYIFGGCEVSLLTAIDFTASNGDPRKHGTLHFNDPTGPNEYEAAIRAVTYILGPYDTDKLIPAYGYGAKLPPNYEVSHCFALNGNPSQPECDGPEGVLDAYRKALNSVTLSGPTIFSQILALASSMANQKVTQESQNYTILLIITDGIISDMEASVREIVQASSLPLSIIIIGVGASDFGAMRILDSDEVPLKAGTLLAKRDIVQFVPYRLFKAAPALLAEQVLAEMPGQILSFMEENKIRPNPPKKAHSQPLENPALDNGGQEFENYSGVDPGNAVGQPGVLADLSVGHEYHGQLDPLTGRPLNLNHGATENERYPVPEPFVPKSS